MPELLTTHPDAASSLPPILFAHGASQPMTSPFFEMLAGNLVGRGMAVVRFEFPYMAARRTGGKRRPPPAIETLLPDFREAVAQVRSEFGGGPILFGGKSMGGRIASLLADELRDEGAVLGAVCLGYPFHPPKKPDELRTAHLAGLRTPTLIAQGERDPFGTRAEVAGYALSPAIRLHWVDDGDHDFGPRGRSGFTRKGNIAGAAEAIVAFAGELV